MKNMKMRFMFVFVALILVLTTVTGSANAAVACSDAAGSDCKYSSNYSFSYKVLENSRTFNTTSYETATEHYTLNITTDGTTPTASIWYNGTAYTSTITGTSPKFILSNSLTQSTTGNKSFFWSINVGNTNINTSTSSQNVLPIHFVLCNASINTPYINFTFKDEVTSASVNASIPTSNFSYWLGDGRIYKKAFYVLITQKTQVMLFVFHLFREVCEQLAHSSRALLATARALGALDTLASLAEAAALGNYIQPEVSADGLLEIHNGRHPVVERTLSGERFVPNEAVFDEGEIIRIITGPNMSGKSTFLRQVALIVLMAQMGSFVPAESARIGLVDRIFTRIGAQDEIHAGQSTFMVEMIETANILHHATPRSLLILDEIGRGTSTYDGVSIAWAVGRWGG